MADEVNVFRQTIHLLRFEIEWVFGDQHQRICFSIDVNKPAYIPENAFSRAHVQLRFIGGEVLVLVIEHHVAARDGIVGVVVVLDVVSLQAHVEIDHVYVLVRDVQFSLAALRSTRGDFRDPSRCLARGWFLILRGQRLAREKPQRGKEKHGPEPKRAKFGKSVGHALTKLGKSEEVA